MMMIIMMMMMMAFLKAIGKRGHLHQQASLSTGTIANNDELTADFSHLLEEASQRDAVSFLMRYKRSGLMMEDEKETGQGGEEEDRGDIDVVRER